MNFKQKVLSILILFSLALFHVCFAKSAPAESVDQLLKQDYLLGNWGTKRSSLEEKGISFEFVYTGEVLRNSSGGIKKGNAYQGNVDLTLTVDTEKIGLWKGGTFFVYGLNNHGHDLTGKLVGDLQTVSNIETVDTWRLYEIWYEQNLFDGFFSILAGMHDLNSEFDVTEYGGLFMNSSFGIAPDISANVPVSIFSVAAPAVRVKYQPTEAFYLQAAVYDGDPGAPEKNRDGLEFRLSSDEGAMSIYETGYSMNLFELPGTYKLGGWYHTDEFDDAGGSSVQHNGNYGIYFLADQFIYREMNESDQGLGLFIQVGGAPDDRNTVDFYVGGGMHYLGLLPGRDEDELGIAVAHASISDKMRSAGGLESAETTLEITYKAPITPWLEIQPDFQYVTNPGADPTLKNATVFGLRFGITL